MHRGERELTVGWANPKAAESVVEVLVLVRQTLTISSTATRKGASRSAMESDSGGEATEEDMALVATPWGARLGGASLRVYLLFDSRKYSLTFLSCELTNLLLQDAPLGMTSARSASKALRDRHPLMRGVSTSVAAAGGGVTDCSSSDFSSSPAHRHNYPMQAVREWRELYRGPKNGCRISRLKVGE